jgi:ABC-type cobalamin/Fe3+-siderophores transport system ATPase subunit
MRIEGRHITLRRGGATLLSDISFSAGPAGSVAIIGPNGAGKSMFLKTLAGIVPATSGQVFIDGTEIERLTRAERARNTGYLPQHFEPHWDLTVTDLIKLGAERGGGTGSQTMEEALASFELTALRHRHWSTLSGGERGRVLLAMVLVVDPPVLLADEPGASLDIKHRLDLVQRLSLRSQKSLSVVVMHDLDLALRFFDRIVVIERGMIVADAAPSVLVEDRRLDATFGVTFERLSTPHGLVLRPG